MKTETLNQFLEREKCRYKIEKEAAARLVQKAVDVGQRIKTQMEGIVESYKTTGVPSGEIMKRQIHRRMRALYKIQDIQARAFKKAYGVDAPTIPGIG